jgi:tetratricopeptide (TPR) repeat protein
VHGQGNFTISPDIETAYEYAISLQFEKAESTIERIKSEDPENLMVYHIENYLDFFLIFLSEDKKTHERLAKNKSARLKMIKKGDPSSPYYLFSQSEILLQWALARSKFEDYFKAFKELNLAYKLLKENQEKFPDFELNKKSLCIIHSLVGTIPGFKKALIKLVSSLDGDVKLGIREIEELHNSSKTKELLFHKEIEAIIAMMALHVENNPEKAWTLINQSSLDYTQNPLAAYLYGTIALKTGRNEDAISVLTSRPTGAQFYPLEYLNHMLGKAKLNRLDSDANVPMLSFISNFKGQNYIKEAYQKLAWYELLTNKNPQAYKSYMDLCQKKGQTLFGEDEQAMEEAKHKIIPNTYLLQSRLLFDGGYYTRAYQLLIQHAQEFENSEEWRLEYFYRLGRITHLLQNYQDAILYYSQAMHIGKNEDSYYACNAALQIGLIFEDQGIPDRARLYFDKCLDIKPDEHRESLHQKAKVALDRLKE